MLTYVYLGTNDLERAIRFYDATLAPLGIRRCITNDPEWDRNSAGWGTYEDGGLRELAVWVGKPFDQQSASVGNGTMVAFSHARGRTWTTFMRRLSQVAESRKVLLGFDYITAPISMRRMCVTPMATSSRRCVVDILSNRDR